ncbi:MAG: hypothetical protein AAF701_07740 [Pseudomonadota bacterium]
MSVSVTRRVLRMTQVLRPRFGLACVMLLADLAIAALCIATLLISFIGALELANWLLNGQLGFQWRLYWADIQADWSNGLMVWIMVATTFLPTFIHVCLGLGAMFVERFHMLHAVGCDIETWPQRFPDGDPAIAVVNDTIDRVRNAYIWGTALSTVAVTLLCCAIYLMCTL